MRAEENRGASFARYLLDRSKNLSLTGRVEAEGRLVEEDDLRIVDERPRDPQALAHAAAVGREQGTAALGEADLLQQSLCNGPRTIARVPVHPSVEAEVLLARLSPRIAGALGENTDETADLSRPCVRQPSDRERPLRRGQDRRQDPDRRRLAGTVRAEYAEDLTGARGKGQVVNGGERPVPLTDAVCLDGHAHDLSKLAR